MNDRKKGVSVLSVLIRILIVTCLIAAGVWGFFYLKSQRVKIARKPPQQKAVVVETVTLMPGNYQSAVHAMGTVIPEKETVLKAKVSGEVVSVSDRFVRGGLMKKGERLLVLDDADYQIEVLKARSALDKALSDLAIEEGSQLIAKEELKLINKASEKKVTATDLALRKPQLIQARAAVDSARADLEKARLNLSRTEVTVPFNALITEKNVNLGSLVTSQSELATLVDVDAYRVEALVPPDRLSAVRADETSGSRALVSSQYSDQTWQGTVVRLTGSISDKSRMAGLIISVPDPLGLSSGENRPRLLLGDYVDVRILGKILENVYSVPRSILRDGNTIWIYNSGVLEIRTVSLAWKEDGVVYVDSGLSPGDVVVTSDLPAPVQGMALQLAEGDRS